MADEMNSDSGMDRRTAVRELMQERGDTLVVSGLGTPSYDLFAAGDHDGNLYMWGAMGGAALVGLGLALAQPARPILVLTGDGEQLMGLGGLATIATKAPANLTIVALDNGRYGETGMQLSHTGLGIDLHRVAAACGFRHAVELVDLEQLRAFRGEIAKRDGGPRFATLRVGAGPHERALPPRDGVHLKNRFRQHLGLGVN